MQWQAERCSCSSPASSITRCARLWAPSKQGPEASYPCLRRHHVLSHNSDQLRGDDRVLPCAYCWAYADEELPLTGPVKELTGNLPIIRGRAGGIAMADEAREVLIVGLR